MAPLMNVPNVIPQLILNLCTISIATCNKFFDRMTPFNGDKIRPRLTAKVGGQTFSWLFDTGASITCMTKASFNAAFPHKKPCKVQSSQTHVNLWGSCNNTTPSYIDPELYVCTHKSSEHLRRTINPPKQNGLIRISFNNIQYKIITSIST